MQSVTMVNGRALIPVARKSLSMSKRAVKSARNLSRSANVHEDKIVRYCHRFVVAELSRIKYFSLKENKLTLCHFLNLAVIFIEYLKTYEILLTSH